MTEISARPRRWKTDVRFATPGDGSDLGGCPVQTLHNAEEKRRCPRLEPTRRARLIVLLLLTFLIPVCVSAQSTHVERVRRILNEVPLIDGHNDLPGAIRGAMTPQGDVAAYDLRGTTSGDTDLPRLRRGMVGGQFWSVHVPSDAPRPARQQLEQIDIAHRMIDRYPDELELALTASDIERVFGAGKIASLLGIEGGHVIENSLGALRSFFDLGVRYVTLTHFGNTDWADSATDDPVLGGLSSFGEEIVREMNRLGMLVDLSHVSPGTMSDALNVAEAPVIFSHSGVRAIADHPRNVPDSILRRLPANGGIVMQVFYPPYVSPTDHQAARRSRTWPITSSTSEKWPASTTSVWEVTSTASRPMWMGSRTSRPSPRFSLSLPSAVGPTPTSPRWPARTC